MIPYDASRHSLFHPGRAADFFLDRQLTSDAARCAEMARLAYVKRDADLEAFLARANFSLAASADVAGSQAFVATHRGDAVLAFRGTETDDPTDLGDGCRPRAGGSGRRRSRSSRLRSRAAGHLVGRGARDSYRGTHPGDGTQSGGGAGNARRPAPERLDPVHVRVAVRRGRCLRGSPRSPAARALGGLLRSRHANTAGEARICPYRSPSLHRPRGPTSSRHRRGGHRCRSATRRDRVPGDVRVPKGHGRDSGSR